MSLQVHELGLRLLSRFPKLEPQIQSSLIALIDDNALDQENLESLEKSLRRRWERARKTGKSGRETEEAERLAMPLALFYARTRQFDKLQNLFDRYLQNPLLRAPALAEMLHHNLQDIVVDYVIDALVIPPAETQREDHEDIARCGMYNDLVMMLIETIDDQEQKINLLERSFQSFGHRIYGILDVFREVAGDVVYEESLTKMVDELQEDANAGVYVAMTKYFVVLGELGRFDQAFEVLVAHGAVDPVILLDYLPQFLPKYADQLFEPALLSIVELLPLVTDDAIRDLVRKGINLLWDINEVPVRDVLERHFAEILDDELADFVDVLLGDFEVDELDF